MSLETTISIIGFGLSVGAFVPLLFFKDQRREVLLIALATAICFVTAWHAIEWYRYDVELDYVRTTILADLDGGALTYEDILQKFSDVKSSLISDAIHQMLREKEIKEYVVETSYNGESYDTRIYRLAKIHL